MTRLRAVSIALAGLVGCALLAAGLVEPTAAFAAAKSTKRAAPAPFSVRHPRSATVSARSRCARELATRPIWLAGSPRTPPPRYAPPSRGRSEGSRIGAAFPRSRARSPIPHPRCDTRRRSRSDSSRTPPLVPRSSAASTSRPIRRPRRDHRRARRRGTEAGGSRAHPRTPREGSRGATWRPRFAAARLRDSTVVDALASASRDATPDVRWRAAYALGRIGDRTGASALPAGCRRTNPRSSAITRRARWARWETRARRHGSSRCSTILLARADARRPGPRRAPRTEGRSLALSRPARRPCAPALAGRHRARPHPGSGRRGTLTEALKDSASGVVQAAAASLLRDPGGRRGDEDRPGARSPSGLSPLGAH
jgi:hypothetical protein